jgi:pimeloyl-ACP methyl ester carboxylesterase
VVAHDWGGIIAFKVAIDYPERVTRLALLDTLCTVWSPGGVHGYWFKASPYPEEFFAKYHKEFIDAVVTGGSDPELPGRPFSPWQMGARARATWADAEDLEHYRKAFADPDAQASAISYYRYALPFHVVHEDAASSTGERYESLSERTVTEMWTHPEGLEKHPLYANYMDYGPEDRHKRFAQPTLWMFGQYLARSRGTEAPARAENWIPGGNPFADQFSRYFPDLRARQVQAGHFFPEELPGVTNEALEAFLGGRM